jgi:hypothetical protein
MPTPTDPPAFKISRQDAQGILDAYFTHGEARLLTEERLAAILPSGESRDYYQGFLSAVCLAVHCLFAEEERGLLIVQMSEVAARAANLYID